MNGFVEVSSVANKIEYGFVCVIVEHSQYAIREQRTRNVRQSTLDDDDVMREQCVYVYYVILEIGLPWRENGCGCGCVCVCV